MAAENVTLGDGENVIILSAEEGLSSQKSNQLIEEFSRKVGANGKVTVQPINSNASGDSGYDSCIIGFDFPAPVDDGILSYALQILKPDGKLWVLVATVDVEDESSSVTTIERLQSNLKLNGFVDIEFKRNVENLDSEIQSRLREKLKIKNAVNFSCFSSRKPNYEVGASAPLKLNGNATKNPTPAQQVWMLSADDIDNYDDDDDLLDSNEFLDEEDLRKPDPASLRATCGDASTKRKACKNCTCGLAEELMAEKTRKELEGIDPGQKKSSCGSCYLGDAFRCAACPYRGLPAFKPGENVPLQ